MSTRGTLAMLRTRGFDESRHVPFSRLYRVACSRCAALVVNGTATHESGCPNATRECKGCSAIIPASRWARYCEDCQ